MEVWVPHLDTQALRGSEASAGNGTWVFSAYVGPGYEEKRLGGGGPHSLGVSRPCVSTRAWCARCLRAVPRMHDFPGTHPQSTPGPTWWTERPLSGWPSVVEGCAGACVGGALGSMGLGAATLGRHTGGGKCPLTVSVWAPGLPVGDIFHSPQPLAFGGFFLRGLWLQNFL